MSCGIFLTTREGELDKRIYQTVVLGGLLHDIGKFLQRGSFGSLNIEGKHPEVSARFVSAFQKYFEPTTDVSLLKTLVQRHHENPSIYPEDLLVQHANEDQKTLCLPGVPSRQLLFIRKSRGEKRRL